MALPLCLQPEEFAYRMTPDPCDPRDPRDPCDPAPRPHHLRSVDLRGSSSEDGDTAKRRVTFADDRGLALTQVKVFSEFSDPIDIPAGVQELLRAELSPAAAAAAAAEDKLVLDFAQPSSDYLDFHQRLERNNVCLERCALSGATLAGTVRVRNVSFEKRVKLRVTFDTWKSHTDVCCTYTKNSYASRHSDTFSFQVSLPEQLQPHQSVEFAVCYEVGGAEYWDSNRGENYQLVWSSMRRRRPREVAGRHADSFDFGIHVDPYGSLSCSHGILPDWPSYSRYQNLGPYY